VKEKTDKAAFPPPQVGKNNAFQRIQSSIEQMNRGRAKGFVRQTKQQEQHTKKQQHHTKKRKSK
jgi:hypothetical protein